MPTEEPYQYPICYLCSHPGATRQPLGDQTPWVHSMCWQSACLKTHYYRATLTVEEIEERIAISCKAGPIRDAWKEQTP